jgi:hypothetical protein
MITATLVVGLLAGAVYTQLFAIPSTAGSRSYRSPCPSPAPVLTTSNVSARDVNAAPRRHHERDPSAALNPRRAPDSGVAIGLGTDIAAPAFARRQGGHCCARFGCTLRWPMHNAWRVRNKGHTAYLVDVPLGGIRQTAGS